MKRILFAISAAALLTGITASCRKESIGSGDSRPFTVTATIAGDLTKVSYKETPSKGLKPSWELNDIIIGFDDAGGTYGYKVTGVSGNAATFSIITEGEYAGSVTEDPASGTQMYMIYAPGAKPSAISGKSLTVDISVQSRDTVPALMMASAMVGESGLALSFRNLMAIVALKNPVITGASGTLSAMSLSGGNIYTKATFAIDGQGDTLAMTPSAVGTISKGAGLVIGKDGATDGTVYFAVCPTSAAADLSFRSTPNNGEMLTIQGKSMEAGHYYYMDDPALSTGDYLCFTALEDGAVISMKQYLCAGEVQELTEQFKAKEKITFNYPSLEYSTDGGNWADFSTPGGALAAVALPKAGDKVYIRAKNPNTALGGLFEGEVPLGNAFSSTKPVDAGGNVMCLLDGQNIPDSLGSENQCAFAGLFVGMGVVNAKNLHLPFQSVSDWCYAYMFCADTVLVTAPSLTATVLVDYCYYGMFACCKSLSSAPDLPDASLAEGCYAGMFASSGIYTPPSLLATALEPGCYYGMFSGCENLASAPSLPATELKNSCYSSMFNGCTGLKNAPDLPATALDSSSYEGMFKDCTGLTKAPAISAKSVEYRSCEGMFAGCINLTDVQDTLYATVMADCAYSGMYRGCTSLVTTPVLPATKLGDACYEVMFEGCTKLSTVTMLATDGTNFASALKNWLQDAGSGANSHTVYVANQNMISIVNGYVPSSPQWQIAVKGK